MLRGPAGWAGARHRQPRRALTIVTALCAIVVGLGPASTTPTGATDAPPGTPIALDEVRAFERDPATGRYLVAGDDAVVVLDPAGTEIDRIDGLPGASSLAIAGDDLWVGQAGATDLVRADLTTGEVEATFPLGATQAGAVAVAGDAVWFLGDADGTDPARTLHRLDTGSGTVTAHGTIDHARRLTTIPGSSSELLVEGPGLLRIDLTADPVAVLDEWRAMVSDVSVDPTTERLLTDSLDSRTGASELLVDGLGPTGAHLRTDGRLVAVDQAPGVAAVLATRQSVYVHPTGQPTPSHRFAVWGEVVDRAVAVTPDAMTVAVVVENHQGDLVLELFEPSLTIGTAAPTAVPEGVASDVTIEGQGLGAVAATVAGEPVDVDVVSPTEIRVTLPSTLTVGEHDLELTGPFGSETVAVEVVASTPGRVRGTVSVHYGDVPPVALAGAEVELTGGALVDPVTTTADATGGFSFDDLPPADGYVVTAVDPAGTHPTRIADRLDLRPGATIDLDLRLGTTGLGRSPERARTPLPPGAGRGLVHDTTLGRLAVTVGDSVVVADEDGAVVAEIDELWGAGRPSLADGAAFVALADRGEVARIDLTTGATTRWSTGHDLTGEVAVASGRAFTPTSAGRLVATDLATGATVDATPTGPWQWSDAPLQPIPGSPDALLAAVSGATLGLDTTTVPPTPAVTAAADVFGEAMSAADDRLWSRTGAEVELSSLTPTGVTYPMAGTTAHTPARGGLVGVWFEIYRRGSTLPTHRLGAIPVGSGLALATDGEAAYVLEDPAPGDSALVVTSLAPTILDAEGTVATQPRTVRLIGSGLLAAEQVTVDGEVVPFAPDRDDSLVLQVPGLPLGAHDVEVATPWGTARAQIASRPVVPAAPQAVEVVPGAGSVTVSWEPGDDGGDPVVGYAVDVVGGGGSPRCTTTTETSCTVSGLRYGSPLTFAVRATNGRGTGDAALSDPVTPLPVDGGYVPLTPTRALDTRRPTPDPLGPGESLTVPVWAYGPPPDATAAVLNVTAVGPTADTHLTVWPTGAPRPRASTLNLPAGDTRANLVTALLGGDGSVSVFNNAGDTHVIVDVVGYVVPDGDPLTATRPTRVLDTRSTAPSPTPWTAREERTLAIREVGGVPAEASGVFLNVTVVGPTEATHLTVWPTGSPRPTASSLNVPAGQTRPNLVYTGIGADGTVSIFNNAGTTNVIVDVVGFVRPTDGFVFIGTPPTRALDSRTAVGGIRGAWGARTERDLLVRGTAGVPDDASAVVLNLTAVGASAPTHLTVWPSGQSRPTSSNLNVPAGLTAANLVVVGIGDGGRIRIANNAGDVHVVADIVGYAR